MFCACLFVLTNARVAPVAQIGSSLMLFGAYVDGTNGLSDVNSIFALFTSLNEDFGAYVKTAMWDPVFHKMRNESERREGANP